MKVVGKAEKHSPPYLYDDLLYIWEAFIALSSSRIDFESIKFSEIESWLNLNCIFNSERRQEAAHLIRILDLEYLKFIKQKQRKK